MPLFPSLIEAKHGNDDDSVCLYVASLQRGQNAARDMASDSDEEGEEALGVASPSMPISIARASASVAAAPVVAAADSASAADKSMGPSTSSQMVEKGIKVEEDINGKTRAQTEKLKQEGIRKLEQIDMGISPIFQAPLITVGEQIIIRPLDNQTLNSILSGCPSPQKNPRAALNYLKRTTKGLNCTGEDYKIILQGVMGYDEEIDWKDIPQLNELDKVYSRGTYPFRKQEDINAMWNKVLELWLLRHGDKKNMGPVVMCTQNPKEEVSAFLKRFRKVWTEEAGLGKSNELEFIFTP